MGAAPTRRASRALAAAAVIGAGLAAIGAWSAPALAAGGKVYVSPRGSDRSACTRARPCRTLNRAYHVTDAGQTVVLLRGRYRSQVVRLDPRKRSERDVVFRPAAGARPRIAGTLAVYARHVEFADLRVTDSWQVWSTASDVTFRDVDAGRFVITGASKVNVVGGTVGTYASGSNVIRAGTKTPGSILVDGLTVRGFSGAGTDRKVACLDVQAGHDLTIRRSRFSACADAGLLFRRLGSPLPPHSVLVENNEIVCCTTGFRAIYFDDQDGEEWLNVLVRNNSTTGDVGIGTSAAALLNVRFVANVARAFTGCDGRAVVDNNVLTEGAVCGASDTSAPNGFSAPEKGDLSLTPGAAAIDGGDALNYPSVDIQGTARPIGGTPDAGAYESSASGLVAAYPFNEVGGTLARDVSGQDNAGTVSGARWTTAGRLGGALAFDGVNDWVTVPDAPSLDLSSAMTLEAWVRPNRLGTTWRTAVIKEQPGNLAYALYANTDQQNTSGHVFVGADRDARSPAGLPLGMWSHLATTYDGTTLRLYLNGAEVSRRLVGGAIQTSGEPLRVGGNSVWSEWFAGQIDEVKVYSRVLSQRELKKDMTKALRLPADTQPPTPPGGLAATDSTSATVSVSWQPSSDDVAVAGYSLYRNGVLAGSTSGTSYTFTGLACGTSYTLAVEAYDAAGNRSSRTSLLGETSACPLPDTQAPSDPTELAVTVATGSTISLAWSPSSDDVGVTGYGLYRDGASAGTASATSFTFAGLTCGSSYTLGVDAYDAAGNRSTRASVTGSTTTCPVGGAAVYVSPSGNDANACTQSAPCRGFDRAYRVARPGDVVEVAGGTYGGQTINTDSTKTSTADVVFRPAAGATVNVTGEVSVYGDHVELRDMKLGGWKTYLGTDDVTFRDVATRHLFIWSSSNISVIGGEVGVLGQKTSYDPNVTTASGSSTPPTNILIDGVWFHDWIDVDPGQANHIECLQVGSGVNVTIRNSRFERCGTHDIFIRSWGTLNGGYHPLTNFVVENNFFAKTTNGYYAIQFVDDLATTSTSFIVRNNSTLQAFHDSVDRGTISFVGNIIDAMTSSECSQSAPGRWSYNVYESGVKCGSTDVVGAVSYRNRAALDLHLLSGSTAIGRGSPSASAATDIDGQARPLGGAPDAGADEVP